MKLSIPRSALLAALSAVRPAACATTAFPILGNVLIVANEKSITLTGADPDLSLRIKTEASVADTGKTTVRAALLYDIARSTTGETVTLRMVRNTLHVECGTAKFDLATMPADDYPPFPRIKEAVEFGLGEATLHTMFARTVFATSTDTERLIFNSSLLQCADSGLTVAACDGRRLGLITATLPSKIAASVKLVLPSQAVVQLMRLLDAANEDRSVQISASKNMASFTFGEGSSVTLVTKLIEGDYPDYTKIIPKSEAPVASIARVDLLHAVDLVKLVADGVQLDFRKQSLFIQSTRAAADKKDLFGNVSDSLLCASTRDLAIKLNADYLRDALRATRSEVVDFYTDEAGRIAMLKSPDENWLAVIAAMADAPAGEAPASKPEAEAAK